MVGRVLADKEDSMVNLTKQNEVRLNNLIRSIKELNKELDKLCPKQIRQHPTGKHVKHKKH